MPDDTKVPPLLVLQALAEARALLFKLGEYDDLEHAMAGVFWWALDTGLADQYGDESVIAVVTKAFEERLRA
jgi:hypothetical protein